MVVVEKFMDNAIMGPENMVQTIMDSIANNKSAVKTLLVKRSNSI